MSERAPAEQWATWLRDEHGHLELELHLGGRWLAVTLRDDGSLTVRPRGGPNWSFGRPRNEQAERLPRWRSTVDPALHRQACRALADAGFPALPLHPPVPDESPSVWVLRSPGGEVARGATPSRLLRALPALGAVTHALDGLAYELTTTSPPTDDVPNPELAEWASR